MSGMHVAHLQTGGALGHLAQARAIVQKRIKEKGGSHPGSRAWGVMSLQARMVLVALCLPGADDPERDAARTWLSFTDAERATIGAAARDLSRQLSGAGMLR